MKVRERKFFEGSPTDLAKEREAVNGASAQQLDGFHSVFVFYSTEQRPESSE